jgi:hypothetical protein
MLPSSRSPDPDADQYRGAPAQKSSIDGHQHETFPASFIRRCFTASGRQAHYLLMATIAFSEIERSADLFVVQEHGGPFGIETNRENTTVPRYF